MAAQKDEILNTAQTAVSIVQNSHDTALRHRELAVAHVLLGDVFKAINANAEALQQYQEARWVIDNFTATHPNDLDLQPLNEFRQDVCNKGPDVCQ